MSGVLAPDKTASPAAPKNVSCLETAMVPPDASMMKLKTLIHTWPKKTGVEKIPAELIGFMSRLGKGKEEGIESGERDSGDLHFLRPPE